MCIYMYMCVCLCMDDVILYGNSVQFSSVAQSCPTLCYPMNCSMPGLPVHHQLPEFTQTHAHRVGNKQKEYYEFIMIQTVKK